MQNLENAEFRKCKEEKLPTKYNIIAKPTINDNSKYFSLI
jgi:hypothetical protein